MDAARARSAINYISALARSILIGHESKQSYIWKIPASLLTKRFDGPARHKKPLSDQGLPLERLEQLRSLSFANLTSASSVQSLMATPANGSEFLARSPTEVVTLSAYPTPDASNTQITLSAEASSANINSTDSNLANAKLVKINVTYTWTETFGGRSRSEQSETIVSAGTKK